METENILFADICESSADSSGFFLGDEEYSF
jgi:hypothetical protein